MSTFDRYTGIQTVMERCGKDGCNFLCLLSIAEEVNNKPIDFIDAYRKSSRWLTDDFDVKDNLSILSTLTGRGWRRDEVKEIKGQLAPNEYSIAIYYNPRTGRQHYRRRSFDTLIDSVTVKEGYIQKYYIYSHS